MSDSTKKVRVTIPAVNLDKIFGPRVDGMGETETAEPKSRLVKKQEELEKLELEEEILDVEDRIERRRRGDPAPESPKSGLEEKLMDQVVIPLVNRSLQGDDRRGDSNSTVDRALRIAEKAVGRAPPKSGEGKSAMDELDQGIQIFSKIKDLIQGEKEEKEEGGEATKKETDALVELDRGLDLVRKIREVFPSEGSGGGMSESMMEFKRWEKEFELDVRRADREERLERRRIDKGHDARLIELGIEKERNDLLRDGFKRVGRAFAIALGEEEDLEDEEEEAPTEGRRQLIKEICSECRADILIPPEAQVAGQEIGCSSCKSVFVWE